MEIAKLFQNGQSQAVRLPKEFCFTGEEVFIKKIGLAVLLLPKDKDAVWKTHLSGLNNFSDDIFADERSQPQTEQEREAF